MSELTMEQIEELECLKKYAAEACHMSDMRDYTDALGKAAPALLDAARRWVERPMVPLYDKLAALEAENEKLRKEHHEMYCRLETMGHACRGYENLVYQLKELVRERISEDIAAQITAVPGNWLHRAEKAVGE